MVNPYLPPKSEVDDIGVYPTRYQEINVWSSTGRIGRLRYITYVLGGFVLIRWLANLLQFALWTVTGPYVIPLLALSVFLLLASFATIQRSHDMNWSGWTALLTLIPLAPLMWAFKPGTPHENDYGDPPTPNTMAVRIVGVALPALVVIGILAAIALPAYQSYVKRAHMSQQQ